MPLLCEHRYYAYTRVYFACSVNKNHAARTFFTTSFRLSRRTRVKFTHKSQLPGILKEEAGSLGPTSHLFMNHF